MGEGEIGRPPRHFPEDHRRDGHVVDQRVRSRLSHIPGAALERALWLHHEEPQSQICSSMHRVPRAVYRYFMSSACDRSPEP
jgi:hypothetical protein